MILNPTAGGGRLLRSRGELDAAAHRCGVTLQWRPTSAAGHATALARELADEGHEMVLAFGGDGTYNEVARGLLGSGSSLAVLPGGTTSVLVYELGLSRRAGRALEALIHGSQRAMRVGRTNHGEIFLLMLSAGPDTVVLERLMPTLKRLGGRVGVAVQAVVELLRWRALPRFRLEVDGSTVDSGWVIVGKSRCYAGPYHATPGADPFTPGFEVVALEGVGRRAALPFVLALPSGRHLRRPDVVRIVAEKVRLLPIPRLEAPFYQVDGDLAGQLPVEISVDPRELLLRIPSSSA